jgi:hypothetical protein
LQTSLTRMMTLFGDLSLSLSANKSEMMTFSRKHENSQVSVRLGQTALRYVTEFKYLGIIFDKKLTWRLHAEYIQRICHARVNFMKSIEGRWCFIKVLPSLLQNTAECASLGCLNAI